MQKTLLRHGSWNQIFVINYHGNFPSGKLQTPRSKNTSFVCTWLTSLETWSLQYCVVIMLPAKVLPKHLSNSHLDVVDEEGVTTEKRTKWRSTGRGKGGVKLEHCLSQFYQGLALNIAYN